MLTVINYIKTLPFFIILYSYINEYALYKILFLYFEWNNYFLVKKKNIKLFLVKIDRR